MCGRGSLDHIVNPCGCPVRGQGEWPKFKLLSQENFAHNRKVHFGFHRIDIPLIKVLLDLIEQMLGK